MQSKLSLALATAVLSLSVLPVGAQTAAAGPYYAVPSWDQTLACTSLANCPRFVVLTNLNGKAVLDRETGLVWLREAYDIGGDQSSPWSLAWLNCTAAHWGTGRMGWRLPTVSELGSLLTVAPSPTFAISLPPGHPFALPASIPQVYWTSTEAAYYAAADGSRAMVVNVANGAVVSALKTQYYQYWCVRGHQ
jgi:hypothetical protein